MYKFSPRLTCPKCDSAVVWDKAMRYGKFVCPRCGEKLQLQMGAPNLIPAIGVLVAFLVPLLAGARKLSLLVLTLVLLVPSVGAVSFVLSFFIRPVLIVSRPREPRQRYRKNKTIITLFDKRPK
jgi:hypothetical protein